MKQRTLYQVRVTQEIPFCDYDEDGEETQVSSGRIEEYVAGRFSAEHNAKLFAEALENKIAEGSGYVTNCFTPKVSIIKIIQTEELVDEWKGARGFSMSKCIVKILRDETPGGLAEKINKELEKNTRSWDTVTGIKYQVAVIPIMRGKEIAGFKTEYSALIPG